MKVYLVGGAVRDELLGRDVHDRDYVVVGSTHEAMIAQGFTQVGADFPVYLHPKTKEEYALARQERKTGPGYHGFETRFGPDVTLEQDLSRRDLTINAMAKDLETGEIIDPFGGQRDLNAKILRATTEAFEEDPLRILRLFRFKAQFGLEWKIAHGTLVMVMRNIHQLEEIPAERKWKEFEKALSSKDPQLFVEWMSTFGQLPSVSALVNVPQPEEHHPEGDAFTHTLLCMKVAAKNNCTPEQVFAMMCHDLGKAVCWKERGNLHGHEAAGVPLVKQLCEEWKVPSRFRDLALAVTEHHGRIHQIGSMSAKSTYDLIKNLRGEKDFTFFSQALMCGTMDAWGRGPTKEGSDYPQEALGLSLALDLKVKRKELSEFSKVTAEKWKGNPEMIASLIRAEKISIVRKCIVYLKGGK